MGCIACINKCEEYLSLIAQQLIVYGFFGVCVSAVVDDVNARQRREFIDEGTAKVFAWHVVVV